MQLRILYQAKDTELSVSTLGWERNFVPKLNILGTVSVLPRKKVLIPRHSEFRGRANSEARNGAEWNGIPRKNEVLRNLHSFSGHSDGLYILL